MSEPHDARAGGTVVELRHVSVQRGGRDVLVDVDVALPAGRVIGVIGPSGCGKSTLMRSIVGVQQHVAGSITVLGRPAGEPSLRGEIGYVTQDPSVYGDLTARENLVYIGRLLGVDAGRIDEVLATVRLDDMADHRVDDMSGGQRARVSLAMALLNRAPLLVLDEPTVGLDPVLRRELWQRFEELAASGRTLLVSSHVMDEAERCAWLLLLRDGRLLAHGTPAQLRERTGTGSIEDAFLALVDAAERDDAADRPTDDPRDQPADGAAHGGEMP